VLVEFFTSEDVTAAAGSVFDAGDRHDKSKIASAQKLLWNGQARRSFARAVEEFKPDVVHYHSIYHQLSPSLLGVFTGPQIMTLHDYKLAAPCYTLVRDGQICTECVGKTFATPAVKYRCVKDSAAASFLCSAESLFHRRRYEQQIDRFIVPSNYSFSVMVQAGLDPAALAVVPWGVQQNALPARPERPEPELPTEPGLRKIIFVGRLHITKGVEVILEAWRQRTPNARLRLVIAGEGALVPEVQKMAAEDSSVHYLGMVDPADIPALLRDADLMVMPSLSPETMGLSALESLVQGTPILASTRGALGDLAGAGVIQVDDMHPEAWAQALDALFTEENLIDQVRRDLAGRDLSTYTQERMVTSLHDHYLQVIRLHSGASDGTRTQE
jgi:glycosyltransferase involved in cell wall biosynthesis